MTLNEFVEICKPYCIGYIRITDEWDDDTEVWVLYKDNGIIRFLKNEGITVPHVMKIYNDSIMVYDKYGIRETKGWNEDQKIDINDKKTLVKKLIELNKLSKEIILKKKLKNVEDMF
jgi:hypothetical protein